jgi:hypothetical protein
LHLSSIGLLLGGRERHGEHNGGLRVLRSHTFSIVIERSRNGINKIRHIGINVRQGQFSEGIDPRSPSQ